MDDFVEVTVDEKQLKVLAVKIPAEHARLLAKLNLLQTVLVPQADNVCRYLKGEADILDKQVTHLLYKHYDFDPEKHRAPAFDAKKGLLGFVPMSLEANLNLTRVPDNNGDSTSNDTQE